jgi:hypothetical protein
MVYEDMHSPELENASLAIEEEAHLLRIILTPANSESQLLVGKILGLSVDALDTNNYSNYKQIAEFELRFTLEDAVALSRALSQNQSDRIHLEIEAEGDNNPFIFVSDLCASKSMRNYHYGTIQIKNVSIYDIDNKNKMATVCLKCEIK